MNHQNKAKMSLAYKTNILLIFVLCDVAWQWLLKVETLVWLVRKFIEQWSIFHSILYHCVGGSTPVFDEVVISLSALNKVISIDEVSGRAYYIVLYMN